MSNLKQPALLGAALEHLRLDGAIFFRSEFTDAFEFESTPGLLAGDLHPGAERIILFHIVARGSCWVATEDGERHWADEGDVIVLPYGDQHRIGGEHPTECVSIFDLMDLPPWTELPVVRHGGGGPGGDLVCGYLYSEDPLFDPALQALPPAFVVRPPSGAAAGWVQASIEYALEGEPRPETGFGAVATRLPELVLVEVLRLHLASAPAADHGWIAALDDPVLAPALSLIHGTPEHKWTVAELASAVAVVEVAARRAVPTGPRTITDPLPDRVAYAPRRGAARHHPDQHRRDRPAGRLPVGGGVQPGVQAGARDGSQRLAPGPRPPLVTVRR